MWQEVIKSSRANSGLQRRDHMYAQTGGQWRCSLSIEESRGQPRQSKKCKQRTKEPCALRNHTFIRTQVNIEWECWQEASVERLAETKRWKPRYFVSDGEPMEMQGRRHEQWDNSVVSAFEKGSFKTNGKLKKNKNKNKCCYWYVICYRHEEWKIENASATYIPSSTDTQDVIINISIITYKWSLEVSDGDRREQKIHRRREKRNHICSSLANICLSGHFCISLSTTHSLKLPAPIPNPETHFWKIFWSVQEYRFM